MKLRFTLATAALALAGVAFTAPAAKATSGDLYLSFRLNDNTNTNDLEIDLGASSLFTTSATLNLTYGSSYYAGANLGGLSSTDLDTVFGTTLGGWKNLSNLVWDVAGHTGTTQTTVHLFATQPTTGSITAAAGGSSLTAPGGRIETMSGGFGGSPASGVTLASPQGYATAISAASQSEYTGALRNAAPTVTTDFGFFGVSTESLVAPSGSVSMELYNYGNNTRADLGRLTMTSTGNLTFTGSAVPEPSTFSALAGGLGLLGFVRRRRVIA